MTSTCTRCGRSYRRHARGEVPSPHVFQGYVPWGEIDAVQRELSKQEGSR